MNGNLAVKDYRQVNTGINLIKIHDGNMVERAIRLFLDRKIAGNTRNEYERDILQFFGQLFGIDSINMITDNMIRNVDAQGAEEYFKMIDDMYAANTVNRKISSIKELFNYLNNRRVVGNDGQLLVNNYNPINVVERSFVDESTRYGSFSQKEVSEILKIAMFEDGVFYKLLGKTSVRKEAIRALNINTSFVMDNGMWCIVGCDKGKKGEKKKFKKAIGQKLYDDCKKLADKNKDGKVFSFGENTPLNRLRGANGKYKNGYCYKIGISEEEYKERNLCIHSFKKTGVQIVTEKTGNVRKAMEQGNHNNVEYTMDTYQTKVYNPYDDPSNLVEFDDYDADGELDGKLRKMNNYELRELVKGMIMINDDMRGYVMNVVR